MSDTRQSSRVFLMILDRVNNVGITIPCWRVLLALSANKGSSKSIDIYNATCVTFSFDVASPMMEMGMFTREKQGTGAFDGFLYSITQYGIQVLDYIESGEPIK